MQPPTKSYFEKIIYKAMYPTRKEHDPQSFSSFLDKFIIPEIRKENMRYYGREDERGVMEDAMYPGHDYCSLSARIRLGDFEGHEKLFKAFDELNLCSADIYLLCVWEGTKSAKERYEAINQRKVKDLTWDGIAQATPSPRRRPTVIHHRKEHQKSSLVLTCPPAPTRPRRTSMDYYGNPLIWSNSGRPAEQNVEAAERGFRHSMLISAATLTADPPLPRIPLQDLTPRSRQFYHTTSGTYESLWNDWIRSAQGHGLDLPAGPQNAALASHIPTHYAYATTSHHHEPHSIVNGISSATAQALTPPETPPRRHAVPLRRSPSAWSEWNLIDRQGAPRTPPNAPQRTSAFDPHDDPFAYDMSPEALSPLSPRNRRSGRNMVQ